MYTGTKRKKTLPGFTLIEMIVSIGIFLIMMVALSTTFVSGFASFANARDLERDVESAQFAMNTLSKYLRTSTIISSSSSDILFYDYSATRCFEYQLSGNVLQARMKNVVAYTSCDTSGMGSWFNVTTGYITGQFGVIPSTPSPKKMGKVTISLDIRRIAASTMMANIQTSVSLRDYQYVGN